MLPELQLRFPHASPLFQALRVGSDVALRSREWGSSAEPPPVSDALCRSLRGPASPRLPSFRPQPQNSGLSSAPAHKLQETSFSLPPRSRRKRETAHPLGRAHSAPDTSEHPPVAEPTPARRPQGQDPLLRTEMGVEAGQETQERGRALPERRGRGGGGWPPCNLWALSVSDSPLAPRSSFCSDQFSLRTMARGDLRSPVPRKAPPGLRAPFAPASAGVPAAHRSQPETRCPPSTRPPLARPRVPCPDLSWLQLRALSPPHTRLPTHLSLRAPSTPAPSPPQSCAGPRLQRGPPAPAPVLPNSASPTPAWVPSRLQPRPHFPGVPPPPPSRRQLSSLTRRFPAGKTPPRSRRRNRGAQRAQLGPPSLS